MVQVVLKFQGECVIVTPHHFQYLCKQTNKHTVMTYDAFMKDNSPLPSPSTCSGVIEMISWAADHASIFGLKCEAMERTFTTFDMTRVALPE